MEILIGSIVVVIVVLFLIYRPKKSSGTGSIRDRDNQKNNKH